MIAILKSDASDFQDNFESLLGRGMLDMSFAEERVKSLLGEIKTQGAQALLRHVACFDGWNPKSFSELRIPQETMRRAYEALDSTLKEALELAYFKNTVAVG